MSYIHIYSQLFSYYRVHIYFAMFQITSGDCYAYSQVKTKESKPLSALDRPINL